MTWIIITLVSLIVSAMFSGIEIAYVTSDRVRASLDSKKSGVISHILHLFYTKSEFFISTLLVGNNIALVIYGMGAAYLLEPPLESLTSNEFAVLVLQTLISTAVILFCGEFFPKTMARINPNATFRFFALPMWLLYILLYPIALFATFLSRAMMRLLGIKDNSAKALSLSIGDLNQYLERTIDAAEDAAESATLEKEVKIFHNAIDLSTTPLRDCSTPRNEIFAVDIDRTSRSQLIELFQTSGRSKIIVYRTDIDNILGYIHVSELFHPDQDWRQHLKDVIYAPETLMANKLMRRLLAEKRSIAIVIDEYGGTSGMVTLEDLVEEIFGDIRDEHDREAPLVRLLPDGAYEISGRTEIETLNENYHLDLPESDDYQTLAGYILWSLGEIPAENQIIPLPPYTFTILKKTATRLELIKAKTIPASGEQAQNTSQPTDG